MHWNYSKSAVQKDKITAYLIAINNGDRMRSERSLFG